MRLFGLCSARVSLAPVLSDRHAQARICARTDLFKVCAAQRATLVHVESDAAKRWRKGLQDGITRGPGGRGLIPVRLVSQAQQKLKERVSYFLREGLSKSLNSVAGNTIING
jgi:hypothetical protein